MQPKQKRVFRFWAFAALVIILIISLVLHYLPIIRTSKTKLAPVAVTPALIQRGSYLANHVAVCMDCHGQRDWTRYSGPPMPGTKGIGGELFTQQMGFPGRFYAKNITPGALKGWSDKALLRAITTGVAPGGEVLFPVMPYPYYRHLDPTDAAAIIAYLRTLPPSDHKVPNRIIDFPMNIILRLLPTAAELKPKPPMSDTVAYGGYLTTIAGCAECHTEAKHGQIIPDKLFMGGRVFNMPAGELVSPNITADRKNGIGAWTRENFIKRFKAYEHPEELVLVGPKDKNTIMPWSMYAGMDSVDLAAIYDYLRSVPIKEVRR